MAAINVKVMSNRIPKSFAALAVSLACQSLVAATAIEIEDLQGVVTLIGMRNLALEMTDACIHVGETANGDIALSRFRSTWKDRYQLLDQKPDQIYYALPDRARKEMEHAVRARLRILEPAKEALLRATNEERHDMCSYVVNKFMPHATEPEALLSRAGAKTTVERILSIGEGQIRETADRLRKSYRTPEAFKEVGK